MIKLSTFLIGTLARALVLLAFSEYVFFNEGPVEHLFDAPPDSTRLLSFVEVILFYMVPGALLYVLEPMMTTWPRILLAGAFVGWSIEAAVVPVAYENVPYSYFWTSIAWHAVVDVALGWVLLRRILLKGGWVGAGLAVVILGVLTALWSTWVLDTLPLSVAQFIFVTCVITLLLALGYALSTFEPDRIVPPRWAFWLAVLVNLLLWGLWASFALLSAAGLALFAVINGLLLWRAPQGDLQTADPRPARLIRLALLLLFPLAATLTLWAILALEASHVIADLIVPLVGILGSLVYVAAVITVLLPGRKPAQTS